MKKYVMMAVLAMCMIVTACGSKSNGTTEPSTEETLENGLPASKQPDANAPDLDSVILYLPDENGELKGQMDAVEELTEQALLDKLVENGVLGAGVQFVSFELTETEGVSEEAGPGAEGPGAEGPGGSAEAAMSGVLTLSNVTAGEEVASVESAKEALLQTFQDNYSLVEITLVEQ